MRRVLTATVVTGLVTLGGVAFAAAPAEAHKAALTGSYVCDKATGEYVVTWTATNDYREVATLSKVTWAPTASTWTAPMPTTIPAAPEGQKTSVTGVQRVPGTTTAVGLQFHAKWADGFPEGKTEFYSSTVKLAGTCAKPTPSPSAAPQPSATIKATCDDLIITLTNKGDAVAEFTAFFKVADGEYEPVTDAIPVKPGETVVLGQEEAKALAAKQQARLAKVQALAEEAESLVLSIKVSAEGMKDVVATLDLATCEDEPSPSPTPSASAPSASPSPIVDASTPPAPSPSGDSLPVTGSSVGGLAVGAMLALAVGIVLMVVARRRKRA